MDREEQVWHVYRPWLMRLALVEGGMLILNKHLFTIYCLIAFILFGLSLRKSGRTDDAFKVPLSTDLAAITIALGFAFLAKWLGSSLWRFFLIFCSSSIVMPYFFHWYKRFEHEQT